MTFPPCENAVSQDCLFLLLCSEITFHKFPKVKERKKGEHTECKKNEIESLKNQGKLNKDFGKKISRIFGTYDEGRTVNIEIKKAQCDSITGVANINVYK